MTFYLLKGLCYSCTKNTWQNFEAITRVCAVSQKSWLQSKVTFPNLPPAQGHASPSRKLVLPQIDHNYTVGDIYVVYICTGCQSSILSQMVPELINNLICWNCKGCIRKSIGPSILSHMVPELINNLICWNCRGCIRKSVGPVQYRFTIPSLRAQRQVAGSFCDGKKKKKHFEKNGPATCPWASSVSVINPANTYFLLSHSLASSKWRSGLIVFKVFCFFRSKNWASSMPSS